VILFGAQVFDGLIWLQMSVGKLIRQPRNHSGIYDYTDTVRITAAGIIAFPHFRLSTLNF
jgi:hypothetical protein